MNDHTPRFAPMMLACTLLTSVALAAPDQPDPVEPPIVTSATLTGPPSDAVVLFDGKDLSQWHGGDGQPAPWEVADGVVTAGAHDIVSKHEFDSAQLHVEFKLPESGQGQGNSGLYFHNLYEVQIIDSFNENPHKAGQQCAALYTRFPPLVNVCKKPGEWQSYDIIFHGARATPASDGGAATVLEPARFTIFHNGVLVQYNRPMSKGTGGGAKNPMVEKGPLRIQSHGSPVQFRNLWLRPIARRDSLGPALTDAEPDKHAPKVDPRGAAIPAGERPAVPNPAAPADATILFDGTSLEGWSSDKWKLENGYMEVTPGGGSIATKERFSDVQMHVEWATPAEVKGSGQGRGNSGVFVHGAEVQVLDSFNNKTYFNGQAGAIYSQYAPQVNASRPPGVWQSYDIVFMTAKYNDKGELVLPSTFTVLHNGVLAQDHVVNKSTSAKGANKPALGNLSLQDHGNPVRYRNIWVRKLD